MGSIAIAIAIAGDAAVGEGDVADLPYPASRHVFISGVGRASMGPLRGGVQFEWSGGSFNTTERGLIRERTNSQIQTAARLPGVNHKLPHSFASDAEGCARDD